MVDERIIPVDVHDMMRARDARLERQQALLREGGASLICFTMNIAGPVKNNRKIRAGFCAAVQDIKRKLAHSGVCVLRQETLCAPTGNEWYGLTDGAAHRVKQLMLELEERDGFGRLLDIDVLDTDGVKIDRTAFGLPPRACLICGAAGSACASSRAHSAQEVYQRAMALLDAHLARLRADRIAEFACRALLYEVCVTPKPGLVDRENTGSHSDMDIFTFAASAAALTPYFRDCAWTGARLSEKPPMQTMEPLHDAGQTAQEDMLRATGGVNTHKGAIYLMGILCAVVGRLCAGEDGFSIERAGEVCAEMTAGELGRLKQAQGETARTKGAALYRRYGVAGVRGEAMSGLRSVREIAIPWIRKARARGMSLNDACGCALCHLIAGVEDTAFISRAGYEAWQRCAQEMAEALRFDPFPASGQLAQWDAAYRSRSYSPGGCADLLACGLFLLFCEQQWAKRESEEDGCAAMREAPL